MRMSIVLLVWVVVLATVSADADERGAGHDPLSKRNAVAYMVFPSFPKRSAKTDRDTSTTSGRMHRGGRAKAADYLLSLQTA
jgi:hypothetical protein